MAIWSRVPQKHKVITLEEQLVHCISGGLQAARL